MDGVDEEKQTCMLNKSRQPSLRGRTKFKSTLNSVSSALMAGKDYVGEMSGLYVQYEQPGAVRIVALQHVCDLFCV